MNLFDVARWIDGLLHSPVRQANALLRGSEEMSVEAYLNMRNRAFLNLVHYVYNEIPYYRRVLQEQRLQPQDFNSLSDIKYFPILTKDIIRNENKNLRPKNLKKGSYVIRRSGGTTGEPIASYINKFESALETYSYFRGLTWMGWNPNYKRIILSGGSLGIPKKSSSLKNYLKVQATGIVVLPAFELDNESVDLYIKTIQKSGISIITGYASVLKLLSDIIMEKGIEINNIACVFSTAELLPPNWAETIGKAFKCKVKCFYGCGEINSLGYQIEEGGPYIIPDEHVHIESNSLVDGQPGDFLVTSLFNTAQPLIRYQNGDTGIIEFAKGEEKRSQIVKLEGRSSDFFLRRDGSKLSSIFGTHSIFMSNISVKRYQYIQKNFEYIEFRYDPQNGLDISHSEKSLIRDMLSKNLSPNVKVEFINTKDFRLSKSGKHRIMICDLIN